MLLVNSGVCIEGNSCLTSGTSMSSV